MLGKFITHCEDSLTAAVFTHLLHLPSELFWRALRNACYTERLPEYPGELLSVEPWPNWNPEGTHNTNRVVPDLFMRFAQFDLIIEAKRRDDAMQSRDQWTKEVTAYANQYGSEKVPVRMIALGGIWETRDEEVTSEWLNPVSEMDRPVPLPEIRCPVHMCRWGRLLAECQRMKAELRRLKYPSSQTHAFGRILSDLIDLFAWHGYSTGRWFADFNFSRHQLSPVTVPHHHLFRSRILELTQNEPLQNRH